MQRRRWARPKVLPSQPTCTPRSTLSKPNACKSQTMSRITTTMFKMFLIFASMGKKLLIAQSRTPTTTMTRRMVRIDMKLRHEQAQCHDEAAQMRDFWGERRHECHTRGAVAADPLR
jgi:hypothetical protein